MRTNRLVVLALAGVLALTGCGGDDGNGGGGGADQGANAEGNVDGGASGGGSGGAIDPCALLTDDEIAGAVGGAVSERDDQGVVHQARHCEWSYTSADEPDGKVTVSVWSGLQYYAPEGTTAGATGFIAVDGIGDAAHLWPRTFGSCAVIYRSGETVVQVQTTVPDDDVCLDLGRRTAGRL